MNFIIQLPATIQKSAIWSLVLKLRDMSEVRAATLEYNGASDNRLIKNDEIWVELFDEAVQYKIAYNKILNHVATLVQDAGGRGAQLIFSGRQLRVVAETVATDS